MEYSHLQEDVFREMVMHDDPSKVMNLGVDSAAGSGKSTTAVQGMVRYINKYPSRKVLFLAFNKHIVSELQEKVDKELDGIKRKNISVLTCHSYGMRTVMGSKGRKTKRGTKISSNIKVDKNKYYMLANVLMKSKWRVPSDVNPDKLIPKLVKMADLGRLYLCTDISSLDSVAKKYGIEGTNDELTWVWDLIIKGATTTNIIDFTDMLYLPITHQLWSMQYDMVIIDEAQDLSTSQRFLMMKAIKQGGKFVFFGDEMQAINGFAGSDNDSFQQLLSIDNTKLLPLSICYRCPKSVIDAAKIWVPTIQWHEPNGVGKLVPSDSYRNIQDGDMVLCRNTYPLIFLCLKYWSEGTPAYVLGKDIGESLILLIKHNIPTVTGGKVPYRKGKPMKLDPSMVSRMDLVVKNIGKELDELAVKLCEKYDINMADAKRTSTYNMLAEKMKAIEIISKDVNSIPKTIRKCESIFSENDKGGICLSTIHKSKGLEADRVFIIHWDLIPSKFARQDWEIQQERNLQYVAVTRAKKYLGFVTDFVAYDDTNKKKEVGENTEPAHKLRSVKKRQLSFDMSMIPSDI